MNMRDVRYMSYFLNKYYCFCLMLVFYISSHVYANRIPVSHEGEEFHYKTKFRTKINKKFKITGHIHYINRLNKVRNQSYQIGVQYGVNKYLKVSSDIERKYGERFDEDWVLLESQKWGWSQTQTRGVNYFHLGLTGRAKLSFLPGGNWLGRLNINYKQNSFNTNSSLIFTPEIQYFMYKNGRRFLTSILVHRRYKALNFSKNKFYRNYTYLSFLFHRGENLAYGPLFGIDRHKWFSTPGFEETFNETYVSEFKAYSLGVVLSLKL